MMMRLVVVGAMVAIAMPATGGQYMKIEDIKGESTDAKGCGAAPDIIAGAGPGGGPRVGMAATGGGGGAGAGKVSMTPGTGSGDGTAVQGSLDRDIIRQIPKGSKPKPQESRGGVQVAAGDVTGDGATKPGRTKVGDITLKRGAAPEGC